MTYVDERGNSLEWETLTRPGEEEKKDETQVVEEAMFGNFAEPLCEEIVETVIKKTVINCNRTEDDSEFPDRR